MISYSFTFLCFWLRVEFFINLNIRIPSILIRIYKIHYISKIYFEKNSSEECGLDVTLSQLNPVHIFILYFLKTNILILSSYTVCLIFWWHRIQDFPHCSSNLVICEHTKYENNYEFRYFREKKYLIYKIWRILSSGI
jgi:hypothetical protein